MTYQCLSNRINSQNIEKKSKNETQNFIQQVDYIRNMYTSSMTAKEYRAFKSSGFSSSSSSSSTNYGDRYLMPTNYPSVATMQSSGNNSVNLGAIPF